SPTARADVRAPSASFKNLQQSARPGGALNKILGLPAGSAGKRGGLPFGGGGANSTRNQAGSGGGNKFGVPRRSNG
ncbi:MAG: hypothetical protein JWO31_2918, partial [Phycisphaerales bacterium]|nr:hypothetical protein [Phycisphaerales bacterium]